MNRIDVLMKYLELVAIDLEKDFAGKWMSDEDIYNFFNQQIAKDLETIQKKAEEHGKKS